MWTDETSTVNLAYVATIQVKLKSPTHSRILNSENSGILAITNFLLRFPNTFEAVK
jgi:hypothetical protein